MVLGRVGVEDEAELDVVVLLVHHGQPRLVGVDRVDHPLRRVEGEAGAALRVDRSRGPVPLAGEGQAVVAVVDDLVERRVDAPGEEVVVDDPVALRQAQPGLQVDGRGVVLHLGPGAVVARARLELQRGQRLVGVVDGVHVGVDDVEVAHRAERRLAHVVVAARDHARDARVGPHELADADGERGAAAALGAVDVDGERDVAHAQPLRHRAQGEDVVGEAVAHELAEVAAQRPGPLLGGGAHGLGPALAPGEDRVRPGPVVLLVHPPAQVLEQVVGEVGGVGDPGEHPHLVVELDHDDVAAVGLQPLGDERHHGLVPAPRLLEEGRREVVDGPRGRRRAVPADRHDLRVVAVDPEGDALVLQLGHDEGAGPGDEHQVALGAQVDEGRDVALGTGPALDVDRPVGQLVEDPRDVRGDRGQAGLDDEVEPLPHSSRATRK